MKKLALRIAAVASPVVALASGDSAAGEVAVSGKVFGMMIGGLVVMGIMIWLVMKVINGGGKKKSQ
jgi:flagellar biogenesis protein FliO